MINHVRTLLLNQPGGAQDYAIPGEELIDPAYVAVSLSSNLVALRTALFGSNPDRAMLNYRCAQYLTLLHSSPLAEFVLGFDSRVTYDQARLYDDAIFAPELTQFAGMPLTPLISGGGKAPDVPGQCRYSVRIDVTPDEVALTLPNTQKVFFNLVVENGTSNAIPLLGTGYSARFSSDAAASWLFEGYNRPQASLAAILANVDNVGEAILLSAFGLSKTEPDNTFRNLWKQSSELVLRLGAVLLALAYRTEERRLAGA